MRDQRLDKRGTAQRDRRNRCVRGLCQDFADDAFFSSRALPSGSGILPCGSRIVRPFGRSGMMRVAVMRMPVVVVLAMLMFMQVCMSHAARACPVMLTATDRPV